VSVGPERYVPRGILYAVAAAIGIWAALAVIVLYVWA
jgi:hypothetical protein